MGSREKETHRLCEVYNYCKWGLSLGHVPPNCVSAYRSTDSTISSLLAIERRSVVK